MQSSSGAGLGADTVICHVLLRVVSIQPRLFSPWSILPCHTRPPVLSFCLLAGTRNLLFIHKPLFSSMNCSILRASIFVSWVSADGTRTPPRHLQRLPSDKDIFFLPHALQAPSVMKTKYAHLPSLSVSYPALSLYSVSFFIVPSLPSWHLGQWDLFLCPVVVRRDSQ